MPTVIETFDPGQILMPVQDPQDERTDAVKCGANLTIPRGCAMGLKTADQLAYPMVAGAGDGTQLFIGFAKYAAVTDANSKLYLITAPDTATPNVRQGPWDTLPLMVNGIVDPQEVQTAAVPAGAIITLTPTGTVTLNDLWTIKVTFNDLTQQSVTFTVGATATAAAVVAGLIAAWNANPDMKALATVSGAGTMIFTAANLGSAINVTNNAPLSIFTTVAGTGTLTQTITTAATGRVFTDILPGRPGAFIQGNGFWKF